MDQGQKLKNFNGCKRRRNNFVTKAVDENDIRYIRMVRILVFKKYLEKTETGRR